MLVAYWVGVRLLAYADEGQWFGLLLGIVLLALLEVALASATVNERPNAAVTGGGECPDCELPLVADAMVCAACGQSVRAASDQARAALRAPSVGTVA